MIVIILARFCSSLGSNDDDFDRKILLMMISSTKIFGRKWGILFPVVSIITLLTQTIICKIKVYLEPPGKSGPVKKHMIDYYLFHYFYIYMRFQLALLR